MPLIAEALGSPRRLLASHKRLKGLAHHVAHSYFSVSSHVDGSIVVDELIQCARAAGTSDVRLDLLSATADLTCPHAERSEQLGLAARAMEGLPPRDRELVRLLTSDVAIPEIAERLGLSTAAAQRARLRAIDRFRKIYRIPERQRG